MFGPRQSESVLIQKIYTHFKKAPGTHKLGVLYVVDSVTRQWVDQARKLGQTLSSGAPDGTFAAGVNRVTELLPVLLTDIINTAPDDQKVRLKYWKLEAETSSPKLESFSSSLSHAVIFSTMPVVFLTIEILLFYVRISTYVSRIYLGQDQEVA